MLFAFQANIATLLMQLVATIFGVAFNSISTLGLDATLSGVGLVCTLALVATPVQYTRLDCDYYGATNRLVIAPLNSGGHWYVLKMLWKIATSECVRLHSNHISTDTTTPDSTYTTLW